LKNRIENKNNGRREVQRPLFLFEYLQKSIYFRSVGYIFLNNCGYPFNEDKYDGSCQFNQK